MWAFDWFLSKEELLKKTISIDNSLYEKLIELSNTRYQASVNKLINASIEELLKTQEIRKYKKVDGELSIQHSLLIRESLFEGLEKLKQKHKISICKLVNISIKNALEQLENS